MLNFSDFGSNVSSRNKESNFRKAGEVFSSQNTTGSSQNNSGGSSSNYSKWMSFMNGLSNKPSVRQNPSPTNSEAASGQVTAQPVGNPTPAAGSGDGIDYAAWAKDTLAKGGGQDEAYWVNAYKNGNAAMENDKKYLDSYTGIKTWDEFAQNDRNRTGSTAEKNQGTIAGYNNLTEYLTKKNNYDQWMENSNQWRTDS
jgi:hypothetical protein